MKPNLLSRIYGTIEEYEIIEKDFPILD